jgi:hypothetical protein
MVWLNRISTPIRDCSSAGEWFSPVQHVAVAPFAIDRSGRQEFDHLAEF